MDKALAAQIADKYITRSGAKPKQPRRKLSVQDETIVLDALRKIARGQTGNKRSLKGNEAQRIARTAMIDIMQPIV